MQWSEIFAELTHLAAPSVRNDGTAAALQLLALLSAWPLESVGASQSLGLERGEQGAPRRSGQCSLDLCSTREDWRRAATKGGYPRVLQEGGC